MNVLKSLCMVGCPTLLLQLYMILHQHNEARMPEVHDATPRSDSKGSNKLWIEIAAIRSFYHSYPLSIPYNNARGIQSQRELRSLVSIAQICMLASALTCQQEKKEQM
jgi:hypothetical protein